MRTFTRNPLERFMMQRPRVEKEPPPPVPAPHGHFCYGCGRFGMACMRPCYRETDIRAKLTPREPER